MGLHVHIYRWGLGDCTNHGISSKAEQLCLVNVDGPFNPSDTIPAAMLVKHTPFGDHDGRRLVRVVPAIREGGEWKAETRWTMMGGNYAASSDSRFNDACSKLLGAYCNGAVPIHDRIEA